MLSLSGSTSVHCCEASAPIHSSNIAANACDSPGGATTLLQAHESQSWEGTIQRSGPLFAFTCCFRDRPQGRRVGLTPSRAAISRCHRQAGRLTCRSTSSRCNPGRRNR
jgi:hypothetical protein